LAVCLERKQMAKFNFNKTQLKRISKNITKRFDEFTEDSTELQKAGEIVVREIKANSRQGVGFDGEDFPSLKTGPGSWSERRDRLATVNSTNRFYKPSFSNATFMGDTINAIKARIQGKLIVLFGDGNHRRMKGIRVKFIQGSDAPISDILKGLSERGWKILGVSDKAKEQIRNNFIRFIRRKLR
jgi:hypothetical protein